MPFMKANRKTSVRITVGMANTSYTLTLLIKITIVFQHKARAFLVIKSQLKSLLSRDGFWPIIILCIKQKTDCKSLSPLRVSLRNMFKCYWKGPSIAFSMLHKVFPRFSRFFKTGQKSASVLRSTDVKGPLALP